MKEMQENLNKDNILSIDKDSLTDYHLEPRREPKSVRTTITISQDTLETMDWIEQSEVYNLKEMLDIILNSKDLTDVIIKSFQKPQPSRASHTIQKSIVLSSSSLKKLNELSKKHGKSRNLLVSKAIQLMKLLIDNFKTKHKQALNIVDKAGSYLIEVEQKLINLLRRDDPIVIRWGYVLVMWDNLHLAIQSELEDDIPIDPYDSSQDS